MNNRQLLAHYFRQQLELGQPDFITNTTTIEALYLRPPAVQTSAAAGSTVSSGKSTAPSHRLVPPTPSGSGGTTTIKKRLASLRPIEQLVATAEKRAVQTQPAATTTPASTNKRTALAALYRTGCTRCHLSETRNKFVFGAGNADARIMVIGEAPGQEEDEQGLPFVGAAGKLLTTMLAAINLDRTNDVFITNILKCRPPHNRSPEATEIVTCIPLLKQQIDILQPKAILLLGRIAAHALLDITDSIAKMRSRVLDYNGIPCMVIYHPAALLRNAQYKRPAWDDLQQFQSMLATSGIYGSLQKE